MMVSLKDSKKKPKNFVLGNINNFLRLQIFDNLFICEIMLTLFFLPIIVDSNSQEREELD